MLILGETGARSILNIIELVSRFLSEKRIEHRIISVNEVGEPIYNSGRAMMIAPVMSIYIARSFFLRDLESYIHYGPIEGRLKQNILISDVREFYKVVPPSMFVKRMLEESGFRNVLDPVPHGIDLDFWKPSNRPKEKLFLTVSSCDLRKGLNLLSVAWAMSGLAEKGYRLHILTSKKPMNSESHNAYPLKAPSITVDYSFGKLSKEELRKLYWRAQAYVCPSMSEGFCLPILEAMATGLPVLYVDAPPMNEFKAEGVKVKVQSITSYETSDIRYVFHVPNLIDFAEKLAELSEIEFSEENVEKAGSYNYREVYQKLVELV